MLLFGIRNFDSLAATVYTSNNMIFHSSHLLTREHVFVGF